MTQSKLSILRSALGMTEHPKAKVATPPTLTRRMPVSSHEKMQVTGKSHKPAGKSRRAK